MIKAILAMALVSAVAFGDCDVRKIKELPPIQKALAEGYNESEFLAELVGKTITPQSFLSD